MNKNLILSSIMLSSFLLYSGCAEKEFPTATDNSHIDNNLPTPPPVAVESVDVITDVNPPHNTPYIPDIKYSQMKTVQGGTIKVGEHARGFEFPEYKGKIVLLEFFGKECHYCFEEMPIINRIQDKYRDRVAIIGIQSTDPMKEGEAEQLIQEHNMNYPIVDQDEAKSILIYLRDVYEWHGILPYIMLIKDGQIEQVFKGTENSFENISRGIEDIPL